MPAARTCVSLFTGAGGLDIGLERAGWQVVTATDINGPSMAGLLVNKTNQIEIADQPGRTHLEGARLLHADLRELSGADLRPNGAKSDWRPTLLAGGPPCQPWSSAGKQGGFGDDRGLLITEMIRIATEMQPRFVLMENVRGLLTASGPRGMHGEALALIHDEWEGAGFAIRWALVNAADYGAPQRRVRLIMVGTSDHHVPQIPEPTHAADPALPGVKPWLTLGEFLAGLPDPDPADVVRPLGSRLEQLSMLKPGTGIRTGGVIEHQRPGGHWGYKQDCFVADLDMPSRTIRAATTPDWIKLADGTLRRLTWRECAGLQGFPKEWEFTGNLAARYRQIGNAVQTDVAHAFGAAIMAALQLGRAKTVPESPDWPDYFKRRIAGAAADHRANAATRKRLGTATG